MMTMSKDANHGFIVKAEGEVVLHVEMLLMPGCLLQHLGARTLLGDYVIIEAGSHVGLLALRTLHHGGSIHHLLA